MSGGVIEYSLTAIGSYLMAAAITAHYGDNPGGVIFFGAGWFLSIIAVVAAGLEWEKKTPGG